MAEQPGHNTQPHVQLPPRFQGMDDLTNGRGVDLQATWVIDELGLFLTCYLCEFVQADTGKRPVDWYRK